jgi:hypothetical protein
VLNASRTKAVFKYSMHILVLADIGNLYNGHSPGRLKTTPLYP